MNYYTKRPVRFLEVYRQENLCFKIYSISTKSEIVNTVVIEATKSKPIEWIEKMNDDTLTTYPIATLIIHEGREGIFSILHRWVNENMLQVHVYFSSYVDPGSFTFYSENGIITCVWEMAVLWFERNAWINHVLQKPMKPDFDGYLAEQLNEDI